MSESVVEEDLGTRYMAAQAALERGDLEHARRAFEVLLLDAPRFAPAWDGLGNCLDAAGELKKAGDCFRRAMRLDRRSWRSRYYWGAALHRSGELREAARWLREAARMAPEERGIVQRLGLCLFDSGDFDAALAAFRGALAQPERDVRDSELWVNIGAAEMERGDFEAADKAYERACLLSPDDPSVYYNWALVTARQGDRDAAQRLAVRARALEPRSLRSYLLLVNLALEAGRWREAEARIDEMTALPDARRLGVALRAEAARRQGEHAAARSLAMEALRMEALRMEGSPTDCAVDAALNTLREIDGHPARVTGFRMVVEATDGSESYYRPYVVLAENEREAGEYVSMLQDALDTWRWSIIEVERFEHEGEAQTGVYHVLLTRVLFPADGCSPS